MSQQMCFREQIEYDDGCQLCPKGFSPGSPAFHLSSIINSDSTLYSEGTAISGTTFREIRPLSKDRAITRSTQTYIYIYFNRCT